MQSELTFIVEIYEEIAPPPERMNDDEAADDRVADAFRNEFMNAVSQRRQQVKPKVPAAPVRGADGKMVEEMKGPKLGGSRNQRAAMREAMLKEGKK